jgi:ABC-type nitrate/sulfonate/bicarbonate transport system substrate-binding protein
MAHPMGFYAKHKLNVEVVKTAGWAVIRDKTLNGEYDAAHMLSPMPIAMTLGVGSTAIPYTMPAVENINGQAITLAIKHKEKTDPKGWKGFKFAVPLRLFHAQLPSALFLGRTRARSGPGRADPRDPTAGDGGQPACGQHRRLSGA